MKSTRPVLFIYLSLMMDMKEYTSARAAGCECVLCLSQGFQNTHTPGSIRVFLTVISNCFSGFVMTGCFSFQATSVILFLKIFEFPSVHIVAHLLYLHKGTVGLRHHIKIIPVTARAGCLVTQHALQSTAAETQHYHFARVSWQNQSVSFKE